MPNVRGLEIVGQHAQGRGLRVDGVMQPTFPPISLESPLLHGLHIAIATATCSSSDCHITPKSGVGIFFDAVKPATRRTSWQPNKLLQAGRHSRSVASEIRQPAKDKRQNGDHSSTTRTQGRRLLADVLFDCPAGHQCANASWWATPSRRRWKVRCLGGAVWRFAWVGTVRRPLFLRRGEEGHPELPRVMGGLDRVLGRGGGGGWGGGGGGGCGGGVGGGWGGGVEQWGRVFRQDKYGGNGYGRWSAQAREWGVWL